MTHQDTIHSRLDGSLATIGALRAEIDRIDEIGRALTDRLAKGGTLFTAGNGGSAAQALHLAEEFIGRYRGNRPALRAVCLNADPTAMSCIANDFGYEHVFARQCEALLGPTDVLLVLSTSGNSANLVEALGVARTRNALTVGLLGAGGGPCGALCDHSVILEESDSAFVQDAHQVVIHLICEMMEESD
jgi:D-sedoheptulose 7-phosphate isomerase